MYHPKMSGSVMQFRTSFLAAYLGLLLSCGGEASDTDGNAATGTGSTSGTNTTSPTATSDPSEGSTTDPSGGAAVIPDGDLTWGIWTCGTDAGTIDIKAFAMSLGIETVDMTVAGTKGTVDVGYAGSPACARTTAFTLAYPSAGMVTTTSATNYMCSGTCDPMTCTAGTQASLVDTYAISTDGNTVTETRVLDAAFAERVSLQKAAGCVEGDTEIGTFILQ